MTDKSRTSIDEEMQRAERDAEPQRMEDEQSPLTGETIEEEALEPIDGELEGQDIDPEADVLAARVAELEDQLKASEEKSLRAAAEAQNVRRRSDQEVEKARKFALEKFVKELLPVVDSLEKALESMQEDASETHREGVSMTLKMQVDALARFGVEQLDPHGEPFDPQYHEAMTMVPNPDVEPNTVIDVMQKGYLLNGRLVRPAMVVVSKAAE
ncbi:nucleotide exchange factor GrpE [Larsenimonas rhizosphaerae]|uniref:Protein GrpE n=1 Tax=Larsenimonas rhizosphaerae TaxID=2944682 RepID=A0AA41ZH57_9GAMM|nr:nucleotide exchange factor GrpE [Larsenimonas rhizosphaerae]MCM2131492.1 nucleotide exchange factor GrpE [Larsenimonas rhizosphaerae]MCX2525182.1 nucleotide exchange factor GrpE [Larsenimonas rhizosphaerae]